jgi:hypothetical protein
LSDPAERPGDVLFLMGSPAHVRNFESVLARVAERGRRVTVLFEERKPGADEPGLRFLTRLREQYGTVRWELQPWMPLGVRGRLRTILEAAQDYLRYFEPPYVGADRLRVRSVASLPPRIERALAAILRSLPHGRRLLAAGASRAARCLGETPETRRELDGRRPEVVIATPLVQFRTRQRGWLRVARELGIPAMGCVYSWDSLTNRGLMHAVPDRLAVWNDAQRRLAAELHGIPEESIVVAGAWPYDHWFDWQPSRSREEFLERLGLPADRATILYACSSPFIAEREREAVEEWLSALRSAADRSVATANVIVRPHPLNSDQWGGGTRADAGLTVFPSHGADPLDESSRIDYFDSIAHADAVVGVNTSALIESVILDRPALAFPGPRFRSTQEELPHFRLLVSQSGAVKTSASVDEHLSELSVALHSPVRDADARRRFVETFIRPHGNDPSPTERFVAAVEGLLDASSTGV